MLNHLQKLFERIILNVDWSKVINIIKEFRENEFDIRFSSYFEDITYGKKYYFLYDNDLPLYYIVRYKDASGDVYKVTFEDTTSIMDNTDSVMKYIIRNEFKRRKIKTHKGYR
jgi:hypothetical protein